MKVKAILGLIIFSAIIILYEWPQMHKHHKKEKISFIGVLTIGWLLGLLLVLYPEMPSPAKLLDTLFEPIGNLLQN